MLCYLRLFINFGLLLNLFNVTATISLNNLIIASNTSQMVGHVSFSINYWKYLVINEEIETEASAVF